MDTTPLAFAWHGEQIPWVGDIDDWTAAELREVEAITRGVLGVLSPAGLHGAMMAVSIARATGRRIAQVDADLTFGAIRACTSELRARREEAAARAAEASPAVVELTGQGVIGAQTSDGAAPFPGSEQEGGPVA